MEAACRLSTPSHDPSTCDCHGSAKSDSNFEPDRKLKGHPLRPSSAKPQAPPQRDKALRPKSATYVPHMSREHVLGAGAPLTARAQGRQRPSSAGAHSARQHSKTERWREAGKQRWPPQLEDKPPEKQTEVVPIRQTTPCQQENWKNELWLRSLRSRGLALHQPVYAHPGGDCQEIHEQWRCPPFPARAMPYSGVTSSGPAAIPNENAPERWIERPVATGKMALDHCDGSRYAFDRKQRFYHDPKGPHYIGPGASGEAAAGEGRAAEGQAAVPGPEDARPGKTSKAPKTAAWYAARWQI